MFHTPFLYYSVASFTCDRLALFYLLHAADVEGCSAYIHMSSRPFDKGSNFAIPSAVAA